MLLRVGGRMLPRHPRPRERSVCYWGTRQTDARAAVAV